MKELDFSRILCPVTLSDAPQQTVDEAAILAARYDAELRLFHVASLDDDFHRSAEDVIASLFALARHLPGRVRVSAAVAYGDPVSDISIHARLMRADLIVLGANRQLAEAGPLPDITAAVMAHSRCPVLVVRSLASRATDDQGQGFTDILCCVDFLPPSLKSVDCALALAGRAPARVSMLNVLADDWDAPEQQGGAVHEVQEGMRAVRRAARSTSAGGDVVLKGLAGTEIVEFAKRIQSDLIVMGAHSGTTSGQSLGSTTTHVLTGAPCSVLIVPAPVETHRQTKANTCYR
jgi:nucleotide-binding universal stress UspA family protein